MGFVKIKKSNIIKIQTQMNELKYYGIEISRLMLHELLSKYTNSFTENIMMIMSI